ncbi:unnamed protein product [Linum trigynum]|uniref:Uncharacterized protein n=1 Tax=Linum trigynum TaxID=586398 RepID=A0AAV2DEX9_9ROSI
MEELVETTTEEAPSCVESMKEAPSPLLGIADAVMTTTAMEDAEGRLKEENEVAVDTVAEEEGDLVATTAVLDNERATASIKDSQGDAEQRSTLERWDLAIDGWKYRKKKQGPMGDLEFEKQKDWKKSPIT